MESKEKVDIRHPIEHLEERVRFLKLLNDTLITSTGKVDSKRTSYVSKTEEHLRQFEKAIKILREFQE